MILPWQISKFPFRMASIHIHVCVHHCTQGVHVKHQLIFALRILVKMAGRALLQKKALAAYVLSHMQANFAKFALMVVTQIHARMELALYVS